MTPGVQKAVPAGVNLPLAVWPPPGSPVSIASWQRELAGLFSVLISPPPFPSGAARGKGQTVVVLPGLFSPDFATARLRQFLNRQGFKAASWGCGTNFGPTTRDLTKFERLVFDLAEREQRPICLVGASLGGTMAREFAKRRPDCVAHLVTLCSPIRYPVSTPLAPFARAAALLWEQDYRRSLMGLHEPPAVPLTAIVSTHDGIVDWTATVPDPAPNVEIIRVDAAHLTILSDPQVQRIVAGRLAGT